MKKTRIREEIDYVRQNIQRHLSNAAVSYLKLGLSEFHAFLSKAVYGQALLGNLAIAAELMLKAWLASINLSLVFKDMPPELKAITINQDTVPEGYRFRPYEVELQTARYKTPDLNECINYFAFYFPKEKQYLGSHLKFISDYRNKSVHSFLPEFQKYEVDRSAYVALRIYQILEQKGVFQFWTHKLTDQDYLFLERFSSERVLRVRKAIEEASKKAKTVSHDIPLDIVADKMKIVSCPICGNDAMVYGEPEQEEEDGEIFEWFWAESFECDQCGLKLEDAEELEMAGIELYHEL